MLTTLMLTAALAADVPPTADPPPPSALAVPAELDPLETRRLRQARQLRTAGAVLSITGPVLGVVGLGVLVAGALGQDESAAIGGFVLGTTGALASVTGPALLLGGGHIAGGVAWRAHGLPVDPTLGWVAGGLFVGSVGSGLVLVSEAPDLLWIPVVLYGAGVVTGWVWANTAIREAGAPTLAVHPRIGREHVGIVISGRF